MQFFRRGLAAFGLAFFFLGHCHALAQVNGSPKLGLSTLFAFNTGDTLRASYGGNAQLFARLSQVWWVGADALFVFPRSPDPSLINPGSMQVYAAPVLYWNMTGMLHNDDRGIPLDFYTSFSAGPIWFKSQTTMAGSLGGGVIMYPFSSLKQRFGFQFDLKNLMYRLSASSGTSFQSDMELGLGVNANF